MVLSSLIGSTQTTLSTGDERLNIVSELTWMDRGENGGDLKSNMEAERILSSRFDHKCERCIPRSRIDIKFPSTAYSSTHDQMQKELTSLSLNSVSDNESDAEPLISEDLGVKQLGEFSTVSFDGEESTPLSTSQIPLPANSQTSSCMANVLRPLPAPSMTTTTASSFNRIPPLSRLHPLKLRPVAKANSRLSRSKEVRHGASNGRKSPLTALPGGRAPDLESGRNSASAHSHMPRKSSIPCPPPPPRAGLAKRVPIPAARKIV
ncbi:unnamed protein product [Taenia asiatica]|uniref:GTSE1_N domain-containing protein n=1 Tax=Taenia asiatica TaxID=60517 RepID=A0A0R3W256_TAEAS|nr:unnamed protein product [Taenia asiatica]